MRALSFSVRVCVCLGLALVLASGLAWGQAGTSTVRGTVTDPQKKAVPGATVTLKNPSVNYSRTRTTTDTGIFSFELVPVGDYTLEVEAKGFRKQVLAGVHALVGAPLDLDIHLEVGRVEETVQVEAAASVVAVNTQDATLGNNILSQQIAQLPMEARDVGALLTLQPGVSFNADPGSPYNGAVNGARSDQSNITLDGIDINEAQTNRLNNPVLRLNSEALEEFRVTTLNANANQGRSSAAQVNLVTKSGTNNWHGSAFEFNRSTGFNANTFFNNRATPQVPRPALIRNTFSGTLGGPIIKDKLFFFYSYEGLRDAAATSVVRIVPLPSLGQGSLKYVDPNGNVQTLTTAQLNAALPAVGISPAAVAVLADAAKKYPANDFTLGDSTASRLLNTAGFRFNAPTPRRLNSHIWKFDWNVTPKQTAFVRFNWIYDHSVGVSRFPDTPSPTTWSHPVGVVAAHTWTISNNWVNNLRYGLTRQAFSQIGDSAENEISFRFIFEKKSWNYTLSRTTPVHNFVDDVSWVKGNHTFQFGGNVRLIDNSRVNFANSFDFAQTNPSGYQQGGNVVSDAISNYLTAQGLPALVSVSETQNAVTSLIGRYSNYTAYLLYGHDGKLLPAGAPSDRTFATQGYEMYFQDAWKMTRNLTLSYGLRYGLSRPVYETQGFEAKPDIPLGTYFENRVASAAKGVPLDTPIAIELSGPANGKSPMYPWDKNDLQPRVAVAWSPGYEKGFLGKMFGGSGKSVFRAGFAMINDYFGEALATFFDLRNALGFAAQNIVPVNVYNVTTKPAPLFTGYNQDIRSLTFLSPITTSISFPQLQPSDMGERIESSLDSRLHSPTEYTWNFVIERQLSGGLLFRASFVGRLGRSLLAQRDAMALNNLVDPTSKMDWYTAATVLEKIRQTRPPGSTAVTPIPYFENIFPANLAAVMNNYYVSNGSCGSVSSCIPATFTPTQTIFWIARNFYANDWTDLQADLDLARVGMGQNTLFFNPQYGALTAWSTIGNSTYHGLSLELHERLRNNLTLDFNYTYGHSLDDSSGLQSEGGYSTDSFILNPIRQHDWYATSSFDLKHVINVSGIYQLPIGRGQYFGGDANHWLDAFIGGWQLSGIFRWNTGLPLSAPFDDARWATNWEVQSNTVLTQPIVPCVTKGDANTAPKLFGCNTTVAYQSFRNAYPGEGGQRNIFRLPGYINLDAGLSKTIKMPYNEKHTLQLRWEVFDVANHQQFGTMDLSRTGYGLRADPKVRNITPPTNWSNFTDIQGGSEHGRRIMQIGIRYSF